MQLAIKEAKKAYNNNDVPVGCVIVKDDVIIAKAYNQREKKKNSLMHAEIIAIDKACKRKQEKFLDGCTIYITLEPCLMCAGAILQSRIKKIVYSINEPKHGCLASLGSIFNDYSFNHHVDIIKGVLSSEVEKIMKDFFLEIRNKK